MMWDSMPLKRGEYAGGGQKHIEVALAFGQANRATSRASQAQVKSITHRNLDLGLQERGWRTI
jgi:hypothetical protein